MKKITLLFIFIALLTAIGCTNKDEGSGLTANKNDHAKGDSTIYGYACDGCTDSTLVLLPIDCSDPVTYDIVRATRKQQVFGSMEVGHWVGVVVNPKNKKEVLMVIDLDELKGTWTYQVLPYLKESATKTQAEIEAELTDSMRELYFVPREYGWTLKRHWQAQTVGNVYRSNSLQDESPVEYPKVKNFTGWHIYNGLLIMRRDTIDEHRNPIPADKVEQDTNRIVYLKDDSLCVFFEGNYVGFHRQKNAQTANSKAQAAIKKEEKAEKK